MRDMVRSSSKLEQSGLVGVATCYDVAGKWRATRAASFATPACLLILIIHLNDDDLRHLDLPKSQV